MTPANWARMKEIFLAAREKPHEEREAFLSEACSDASLRQEVRKLLEAEDRPAVESPVAGILAAPALPAAIGRYRIVRLVGEGGMGAVYEAEQDQPRRTVALKVIKPGLASRELLRRFEHESQALGRLHHPGIAQIYEAGAADSGFGPQPYFAMEFIQGASLLKYAEAHQLTTRQRLELMAKICDAVHHAHQRGIIHRDLKPGNILVGETGQPKILDFGVARATDSDAQATRQTDLGQLVGTLAYMSPEQVLGDPLELDTRSDVYALGVMLFELLAGRLPYQVGGQLPKAVQTIREEDPARLSSISRVYRGDIETIVAKALEKDKARRYQSAANLAADIQHYLKDEPIMARRSSAAYHLRKFARRHRALVTGVAAVFVMLIAGVIASTWEAVRAERAVATANAINDFLQNDLLGQANVSNQARPGTKADLDLTVRTALDRAAARIAGKFDKQPLVEASIRQLMGDTYRQMGLFPEGQRQLEGALALRRRTLGEEHRDTLETMNALALLYEEAGKYAQAEPLHTKVLEIRRRVLGGEHRSTLNSMNNLGVVYDEEGKYALAESLFAKALQGLRRTVGEEDAATLVAMKNLGDLYRTEGKYALAEPLLLKDLELQRRVLGEDHPGTLNAMKMLGVLYWQEGRDAEAEPLEVKALAGRRRVLGEEHPNTLISMNYLGMLYLSQSRYTEAEPLFTRAVEVSRRVLGPGNPALRIYLTSLAKLRLAQHNYGDAEQALREALSGRENESPIAWELNERQSLLGFSLMQQSRFAEAEPWLVSGYRGLVQSKATIPSPRLSSVEEAGERLVQFYENWGKPERAAEWRKELLVAGLGTLGPK